MEWPEDKTPPKKYKWPRVALALVALGIVLAIIWVAFAAHEVEEQSASQPLPSSAPAK